jgi:hypothetical protein
MSSPTRVFQQHRRVYARINPKASRLTCTGDFATLGELPVTLVAGPKLGAQV